MLNKSKNRIIKAITLGYLLIALGTIGLGYTVISGMNRLSEISRSLYDHPFKISQAALRAGHSATHIRTAMLEIGLSRDPDEIDVLAEKIQILDRSIRNELQLIQAEYLGDMDQVENIEKYLNQWLHVRNEIIAGARNGDYSNTIRFVKARGKGAEAYAQVNLGLNLIVEFAQLKASLLAKDAHSETASRIQSTYFLLSVLLIFIGTVAVVMAKRANALLEAEQRSLQEISDSNEKHKAFYGAALDAIVMANAKGVIIGWSGQADRIFGWTAKEVIGKNLHETIIPPKHREAHLQGMHRFLTTAVQKVLNTRVEITALHRDGHEFPVELTISCVKIHGEYEFNAFLRDLTEKKAAEELIWRQANFDPLTQLPNRHLFQDRLTLDIRKAAKEQHFVALLVIDIDQFNQINDTLGHHIGDILLQEAAKRIAICVSGAGSVSRLGGDEFAVILTGLTDVGRVDVVAQAILQMIGQPFRLEEELVYVTASIGISIYPTDNEDMISLFKSADQAMYAAKDQGRNRYNYFTPFMEEAAKLRKQLANDLRAALAENQLIVYYQPIVELATSSIYKAEALIRWQHPSKGLISPGAFIPIAEETGVIIDIGDWVFKQAAQQSLLWRGLHHPEFSISVNKSPVQFHDKNHPLTQWPDYLRGIGLPGNGIVVEITEGLLMNASDGIVKDKMQELRDAGIPLSLDDFGTGYSSLSYLNKFDIDFLKIDQSFVRNLAPDSNYMALCEAIIVMAHKLGMQVIAEGIETEWQRDLLSAAGCDFGQGYLWSKPVPPREFEKLLAAPG